MYLRNVYFSSLITEGTEDNYRSIHLCCRNLGKDNPNSIGQLGAPQELFFPEFSQMLLGML